MNPQSRYDVIILGTGPAGLQAAIHTARKKVSVLALGKESKSSLFHAHIENFCSIFKLSGEEMLRTGREQATNFGTSFLDEDILKIERTDTGYRLETEGGHSIEATALIIATGTARNKLGVPGEKALLGKGVSYCVDCDGNFYRGQEVAVVGNESAAVDGALTLAEIAERVHLVSSDLSVSPALAEKLAASNVEVHTKVAVTAIEGQAEVTALTLDSGDILPVSGVFIEQGAKGLMELATTLGVALDDDMRYIATDKQLATNLPGIYAAGDICGPPWQMAKAVGEGCVAGISAATYAKKHR